MVKKNKQDVDNADLTTDDIVLDSKKKKGKKKKKFPWILIILLIISGVLVSLIRFDVLGIGSKYIYKKIENIPVVKMIIPKSKQNTKEDPYANYTKEQLINIINGNEIEVESLNGNLEQQAKLISDLEKQVAKLQVFEDEHNKFREEKEAFDKQLASADGKDFSKFYEAMYPDTAKSIYSEIVKKDQMNKEQKKYASLIAEMDEAQAAKALENLFATDMDIVILILSNMDMENSALILGQMDSKIAATVIKQLSPQSQTIVPQQ